MVAVVVGSRLGLEQTSAFVLGSRGQIGSAGMGRAGENIFVNGATGNVVVTNRDEFLIGLGPDSSLSRTHNSLATADGDNGDNWRQGVSRKVTGLTGTVNTSGSTITRTDWDGSEVVYTWNSSKSAYETTEGGGAYDLLTWNAGTSVWTWTDGDTQSVEKYDGANGGRITSRADTDGNSLTFSYGSNGLVSRVTTADGGYTDLTWGGTGNLNLTQMATTYWDVPTASLKTLTRVRYAYDGSNRLSTVTVDLSPTDSSVSDGKTYVTTYTYDGSSKRIASISQTDGSKVEFTYETSGLYRVTSVTQTVAAGVTRATSFTYTSSTQTTITDPSSQSTVLQHGSGLLEKITWPAAVSGGTAQYDEFVYNGSGDLIEVKRNGDAQRTFGSFTSNGLWEVQRDRQGQVVKRTYDAKNAVLTETAYTTTAPVDFGSGSASGALTTRYAYDSENHLTFAVSAEGRVTRFGYDTEGRQTSAITYTGALYSLSGLTETQAPSDSTLASWVSGLSDKTAAQRIDTAYRADGQVDYVTQFSALLATGAGDTSAPMTRTYYVYNPQGQLISRYIDGMSGTEAFTYDGLGRMLTATDFHSQTTRTAYYDAVGSTVVTMADGLNRISVYNRAGELVSTAETERGTNLINTSAWPDAAASAPSGTATVTGWSNPAHHTGETSWLNTTGPDGTNVNVMVAGQSDGSAPGGGNITNAVTIDATQAYEFVYYFRKTDLTKHHIYFGLNESAQSYVENITNGVDDGNPYFYNASASTQGSTLSNDRWYKVVGYVLPQGSATGASSLGGVYDMTTGAKVASTVTYRWDSARPNDQVTSRFFVYWDQTQNGNTAQFYKPEIRQIDPALLGDMQPATATQYRYDNMGRLRSVTDPTGAKSQALYDLVGRKVADIDADGSLIEYKYDLLDRLVATVRYATRITSSKLAELTDPAGNPTNKDLAYLRPTADDADAWEWRIYDKADRLVRSIDGVGATTTYEYDGASRLVKTQTFADTFTSTQVTGFKTTLPTLATFVSGGGSITPPSDSAYTARTTRYFYDLDGRQVGSIDGEGAVTQIVYDAGGRVIETRAFATLVTNDSTRTTGSFATLLSTVGTIDSNTKNQRTWNVYDGRGFLRGAVDGEGQITLYDYSPLGHVTQMVRGRQMTVPTSAPSLSSLTSASVSGALETTNYTRNQLGQVLTETRILATSPTTVTETITYSYDVMRRLTSVATDVVTGTDRTTLQRYDRKGRLTGQLGGEGAAALAALTSPTASDINGIYRKWGTTFLYDAADRLISRTDADGIDGSGNRTLYYYNADGTLAYQVSALGEVTEYRYDAMNRLTETWVRYSKISSTDLAALKGGLVSTAITSKVSAHTKDARTVIAYNVTDTVKDTTTWISDPSVTASTTNSLKTAYTYNAFRQQATRVDPKGAMGTSGASTSTFTYDRRGSVKETVQDSGGKNFTTTIVYDAFGRATDITTAGQLRKSEYDRVGRVIKTTDALNKDTSYLYDARGNVIKITDRRGFHTQFSYNAFNRQVTMTTPEGVGTTTTYDDRGLTLSFVDGAGVTTTYAYDRNGSLITETNAFGHKDYTYDTAGRLYDAIDATGVKVRHIYDAANRLYTQTVDPGGLNLTTTYLYEDKGQRTRITDASGCRTDIEFDNAGRQTRVINDPAVLNIQTVYTYDRAGNTVSVKEAAGSAAERETIYAYDNLDRLISQENAETALNIRSDYTYDAAGNVTKRVDKIDGSNNAVSRFVYDAENRLIYSVGPAGGVVKTIYDNEGRVVQTIAYADGLTSSELTGLGDAPTISNITAVVTASSSKDQSTAFIYDDDGRLVFTLDALGHVVERVYDGASNVTRQIVYGDLYTTSTTPTESALRTWAGSHGTNVRTTRAVYDTANRQAYSIDALGYVTASIYDAAGRVVRTVQYATDPATGLTSSSSKSDIDTWIASHGASGDRKTHVTYDAAGRRSFVVDAEKYATGFTYDGAGRTLTETRYAPVFTTVTDGVSDTAMTSLVSGYSSTAATTAYLYDGAGRLKQVTDAEGVVTLHELDGLGQAVKTTYAYGHATDESVTKREFDKGGRQKKEWRAFGATEQVLSTFTYDGLGRMLTAVDGRSNTTTRTYDAAGRVLTVVTATSTITNQYDAFGNVTRVKDPRNNYGYFEYDQLNRLVLQVDPEDYATRTTYGLGDEIVSVTRFETKVTWNETMGGGGAMIRYYAVNEDAALDAITQFERDKLGRLTKVIDAIPSNYEQYTLDAFGNRTTIRNRLGANTTYTYDKRGLMLSEVLPVSAVKADGTVQATSVTNKFEYDARGNLTKTIEAYGLIEARTTNYAYDKLDRLVQKTSDAVTVTTGTFTTSSVTPTETIIYDARGNVIETKNADNQRTLYYYDDLNRKVAEIDAVGTLRQWDYDAANNVEKERIYDAAVTQPSTAGAGGLSGGAQRPTSSGSCRETQHHYDAGNRRDWSKVVGLRVGEFTSGAYSTSSSYDVVVTMDYDAAGNLWKQTDGRGNVSYTQFDALGRVTGRLDAEGYLTRYELDADGNVTKEVRYANKSTGTPTSTTAVSSLIPTLDSTNDRTTTFEYDRNGRRTKETRTGVVSYTVNATTGAMTTGATSAVIQYSYDGLGNVTRREEANTDAIEYAFDNIGRQISATKSARNDHTGTSVQHQTLTSYNGVGATTRVKEGASGASDANLRISEFTYDVGGRLTSFKDATGFVRSFGYDVMGRVVKEQYDRALASGSTATEARRYAYDALGRVIEQSTATYAATWSFGDKNKTQYNAHGEVTGRGYKDLIQETFDYDKAGRLWRTTSGDGTIKFFVHDKAGNTTLAITSAGADLSGYSTIDAVMNLMTNTGANAVGAAAITGVNATISVFDKRGMVTSTREPQRQLSRNLTTLAYTTGTIERSRVYNAFGEVSQETDARGGVTDFKYNTMGRLIEQKRPTVAYTSATGAVSSARPTETYRYDISGRLVASQDANGNWSVRTLLAGSGHGDEEAQTLTQFNADTGKIQYGFDVFGDLRKVTDAEGKVSTNAYDKAGRLIEVAHAARAASTPGNPTTAAVQLTDYYAYDGLGQRIQQWNSQYGSSYKALTAYDRDGRITSTTDMEGRSTSYAWAWDSSLSTSGLGTFGGWTKTTTTVANKTSVEKMDYFGRLIGRTDLGGRVYSMTFDKAGRLTAQSSSLTVSGTTTALQSLTYGWYNTGQMAEIKDVAGNRFGYSTANTQANYNYDAAGNRVMEKYVSTTYGYDYDPSNAFDPYGTWTPPTVVTTTTTLQDSTATYDALGRLTRFTDSAVSTSDPTLVDYTYDLKGNVRSVEAHYRSTVSASTIAAPTQWFKYDEMDRMTIANGDLVSGAIVATPYGSASVEYDKKGNRVRLIRTVEVTTEYIESEGWEFNQNSGYFQEYWDGSGDPPPGYEWRIHYATTPGQAIEEYTYTEDGYLSQVTLATPVWNATTHAVVPGTAVVVAKDVRDAMGRLTSHKEYGAGPTATPTHERTATYDKASNLLTEVNFTLVDVPYTSADYYTTATTTYTYNAETYTGSGVFTGQWLGVVTKVATSTVKDPVPYGGSTSNLPGTSSVYSYVWWDSALQAKITYDADTGSGSNALQTSTFAYDVNGHLTYVNIKDGRPRNVTFVTDVQGQVLSRVEVDNNIYTDDPKDLYYYFGGLRIGEVSNNPGWNDTYVSAVVNRPQRAGAASTPFILGSYQTHYADFGQAYEALTPGSVRGSGSSYTIRDGDTLQSIAEAVWGDSALWYLIAEANGLTPASLLVTGLNLTIPAKVANVHNTSETFRPYDPNKAIGDVNPTQPKPPAKPNKGCGVVGQIIAAAIAVVVAAIIAPYATAAIANLAAGAGTFTGAGVAAGVTSVTVGATTVSIGVGSFVAGGAIAGAAAAIASQGFLIATGAQDEFDWKGVGISALSGGIGAGLGSVMKLAADASRTAQIWSAVKQGALGSVITQGVATAVGLQDHFSWTDVAVAAVSSGVSKAFATRAGAPGNVSAWSKAGMIENLSNGMVTGAAAAATRTVLDGGSFGDNLIASLPQIIGATIGNAIGGAILHGAQRQREILLREKFQQVVLEAYPNFKPGELERFTEAFFNPLDETLGLASLRAGGDNNLVPFDFENASPAQRVAYSKALAQRDEAWATQTAVIVGVKEQVDLLRVEFDRIGRQEIVQNGMDFRNFSEFLTIFDAALLSQDAYFNDSISELMPTRDVSRLSSASLGRVGLTQDAITGGSSGYFAAVYFDRGGDRYFYVNRGTDFTSPVDWVNNGRNQLNMESDQYNQAKTNATNMTRLIDPSRIIFTGHSLGGGLAQAQSSVTGARAIGFNAAWANAANLGNESTRYPARLYENVTVNGDLVTYAQKNSGSIPSILAAFRRDPILTGATTWAASRRPSFRGQEHILAPVGASTGTGRGYRWGGEVAAPRPTSWAQGMRMLDLHGMYQLISALGYRGHQEVRRIDYQNSL